MTGNEIESVRKSVPLVHCITNYVTVNDVANVVLACGGSPIMTDDTGEAAEIAAASGAVVLNIGTLNDRTVSAMQKAGKAANQNAVPVVFDPVGAGASALRNRTVEKLLAELDFTVIRGNLSEISFVAGIKARTRGVDAGEADRKNDAAAVARAAAKKYGCIVVVTGAEDVITDGEKLARVKNGVPEMSRVTGTGCMLSGMLGAYAAAAQDVFSAVVSAVAGMGIAGEIAYEKNGGAGTGSLRTGIIDALSRMDDETLGKRGRVTYEG
ncbi:MAG: hydroxyethylthiazole kinase [Oscillospiraceae bacterium]|nr:hydroxyethylthiazole kinase [Oscillospiraceae bacterium]